VNSPVTVSHQSRGTFIHHDGALGDVLISLPGLKMLRGYAGPLHLAARKDVVGLLMELGWVEDIYDPGSALLSSFYREEAEGSVKKFLNKFSRVAVFTARPESVPAAAMKRMRPDADIVLTIPPAGEAVSVSDFRLRQVAEVLGIGTDVTQGGCDDGILRPPLEVPEAERRRALRFLGTAGRAGERPVVVLQPGSGGRRKCWPLERYLQLAQQLISRQDAVICFVTGPAEDDQRSRIDDFVDISRGNAVHIRNEGLLFVASLMSSAGVYVGNDSGITHLAGLAGCPTIAIFGPTDPLLWKPQGRMVRIVRALCECAPCGDDRSRECPDRRCLSLVSVEQVLQEAEDLLRAAEVPLSASQLR
jgi:hypothetical protein